MFSEIMICVNSNQVLLSARLVAERDTEGCPLRARVAVILEIIDLGRECVHARTEERCYLKILK